MTSDTKAVRTPPRTLERTYSALCRRSSDIHEHLPTLRTYATQCDHVTEFGVRRGDSTFAFLHAQPAALVSYDIAPFELEAFARAHQGATVFSFICASTLEIEIAPTDMLFIDTLHTYCQLTQELALHCGKVRQMIALHDTTTFGAVSEDGSVPGLWQAVEDLVATGDFRVREKFDNNNGLTILERTRVRS